MLKIFIMTTASGVDLGFFPPLSYLYLSLHGTFLGNQHGSEKPAYEDEASIDQGVRLVICAGGRKRP